MDLGSIYAQNLDVYNNENAVSQNISNEMIFDLMAWHVDEVTNNRKSLELSEGNGVKIAVIDSGVDPYHPFLTNTINLKNAKSFVSGESSIIDANGHGTMITGIIHQIAPRATITPYRVIGSSVGEAIWTINAIIAAASGNLGLNMKHIYKTEHIVTLPCSIKGVNGVSAVNNNQLTEYSNYGSNINFCAPGGDYVFTDGYLDFSCLIYGLYPTYFNNGLAMLGVPQGYTFSCGTSLATPSVTAGLADILSYYRQNNCKGKKINNKDVIDSLADGAEDLRKDMTHFMVTEKLIYIIR